MICCYRYPNGISLNGREYLLDGDEIAIFDTVEELFDHINAGVGYAAVTSVEQLEDEGIYVEDAEQTDEWFEHGVIH